jgi:hypothetical protein
MECRLLSGNRMNTINDIRSGIAKIIYNHYFVTGVQQFYSRVTSDISGTAGNQYIHN